MVPYYSPSLDLKKILVVTYLFVIHIRFKPIPQTARREGVPQEHEPQAPDVWRVAVVDQAHHLGKENPSVYLVCNISHLLF